jgi:iron complex transport system ATP-binding protein
VSRLGRAEQSDRAAVDRALERTAVNDLADRSINEVSGGERQRVLLARALAQDTPVLLLDEPTASLDINHQIRTLELVRELADDGKTVVAAIHDLNLAAHYCDELVLLGDRRRVASGEPADVLTEDHLESVFGTRAVVTRHPVTGSTLVMALPEPQSGDPAGRVHVIGGGGSAARILYLLSAAGFEVSVGALNHGDADLETANMLGIEAVTVEPFGSVTEATREQVETAIEDADVTIMTDIEVGEGNLANLKAARHANELVLVEERPFEERNYAGQAARDVYEGLRERGTVVEPGGIIRHVTDRILEE